MKRWMLLLATLAACGIVFGQENAGEKKEEKTKAKKIDGRTMPVKDFLAILRYPHTIESWVKMAGKITHMSSGKYTKMPVMLRGRFQPGSWRMQLEVDKGERWYVRQNLAAGQFGTSKIQQKKAAPGKKTLANMQIRPEDITLSFLYWKFQKEHALDTVSLIKCRVLELVHQPSGERVKVWASTKYFFPIRVQWFKKGAAEPQRQLQFSKLVKVKLKSAPKTEVAMVKSVEIRGEGWKTRIDFDKDSLDGDIVDDDHLPPEDLFITDRAETAPVTPKKP